MVHKDSFLQSYENLLRKKESRLTRISISIVWLFIVCHVWKLIPTIYELWHTEVNTVMDLRFRTVTKLTLCKWDVFEK